MTLDEVRTQQRAAYSPVALEYFQFKAVSSNVTFSGVYVDAYGRALEGFTYTITSTAKSLAELFGSALPQGYVGIVGKLSGSVRVNTGRNPDTDNDDIPITDAHSWIEYATDRYIIGQVL